MVQISKETSSQNIASSTTVGPDPGANVAAMCGDNMTVLKCGGLGIVSMKVSIRRRVDGPVGK